MTAGSRGLADLTKAHDDASTLGLHNSPLFHTRTHTAAAYAGPCINSHVSVAANFERHSVKFKAGFREVADEGPGTVRGPSSATVGGCIQSRYGPQLSFVRGQLHTAWKRAGSAGLRRRELHLIGVP